jgi:hypothetical protein
MLPTPAVNVGVSIDGKFVVLDGDKKHGGMATLAEWERKYGPMPPTPTTESGGDGRHFYFMRPPKAPAKNVKLGGGVELLVNGGVIAPPSLHESGNRYKWLLPPETPLAEMPTWLVDYVRAAKEPKTPQASPLAFNPMEGVVDGLPTFADLGSLPPGARNDLVNSTIGSMLAAGFTPEQITEEGLAWAERQEPPYSADDLRGKVRFFAAKQEVVITDTLYPQAAPLHEGERHSPSACSPFAERL